LRPSQREWFDRLELRQEAYESRLQRLEARTGHRAGGSTVRGALAAMSFLVGVIEAHWPN
jgi:hypothetical protein